MNQVELITVNCCHTVCANVGKYSQALRLFTNVQYYSIHSETCPKVKGQFNDARDAVTCFGTLPEAMKLLPTSLSICIFSGALSLQLSFTGFLIIGKVFDHDFPQFH